MKKMTLLLLTVFLVTSSTAAVAAKKNRSQMSGGAVPAKIQGSGSKTFIFNPRAHSWALYDGSGNRVAQGVANGGAGYCPDVGRGCKTPQGSFRVNSKGSVSCKSSRFPIKRVHGRVVRGGAPMPYCMFFTNNHAIHGYSHLTNANVSHGCIRVSNSAAAMLHNNLTVGSRVIVKSY
jgi:lipoprotein-anchoring transpeptidase ErfK/SrfK